MKTSIEGLAEIAGHEGIVLSPYKDSVGVWTIGVGHTAAAGPPDPEELDRSKELSMRAVFELFAEDIKKYEKRVNDAVKAQMTQTQFDALVSFDYNTGGIHRAKLTEHLNAGNVVAAGRGFDGWQKPRSIIPRRNRERELFENGVYAHGGKATVYPVKANNTPNFRKGKSVDVMALLWPPEAGRQPDDPGVPQTASARPRGLVGVLVAIVAAIVNWFKQRGKG